MRYALQAVLMVTPLVACAAPAAPAAPAVAVTDVRFWTLEDVTRVVVQLTGEFEYSLGRLSNPDRVYFDLPNSRPRISNQLVHTVEVNDGLVRQIRVAQNSRSSTRIVFDLRGRFEVVPSRLANPDRLVVEIRRPAAPAGAEPAGAAAAAAEPPRAPEGGAKTAAQRAPAVESGAGPPAKAGESAESRPAPPASAPAESRPAPPANPPAESRPAPVETKPAPEPARPAPVPELVEKPPAAPPAAGAAAAPPAQPSPGEGAPSPPAAGAPPPLQRADAGIGQPAKRNATGRQSLTRVLGLKVGRVVIDPGHGGKDTGTIGPGGLREKDVTLDVAQRLAKLVEERSGSEVVLTRTEDVSVPLEARTRLANQKRADLFLSIHVNSSRYRTIDGVETFYLNFTQSRADLEVAARENAGSSMSVHELANLVQKIALDDKILESRDFAASIQKAVHSLARKQNSGARNRGVKKAPFVVLIGAQMPSVLVELGFISNPKEEKLMKDPGHRQALAAALCDGLIAYASTLSHFQVAQSGDGE